VEEKKKTSTVILFCLGSNITHASTCYL